MTKRSIKCKKTKDIKYFYKHKQMGDGHLGKCKTCTKKDVHNRYNDPVARLRIAEYERLRFQNPERKKKVLEYQKKSRKLHKNKTQARVKVGNMIRDCKLKRMPCGVCGNPKSQAHHLDYRSPLKIKWLCFKHHRAEHNQKTLTC
jgi:hypothetical protein